MNIVCDEPGVAGAVLIRALHPTHGLEFTAAERGVIDERPCSAAIPADSLRRSPSHESTTAARRPAALRPPAGAGAVDIVTGTRIGITKAADCPGATASRARASSAARSRHRQGDGESAARGAARRDRLRRHLAVRVAGRPHLDLQRSSFERALSSGRPTTFGTRPCVDFGRTIVTRSFADAVPFAGNCATTTPSFSARFAGL